MAASEADELLATRRRDAVTGGSVEELLALSLATDPVGAVEIAARLGVARRTVDSWRQRDRGFPEPRWTVGGRPAWAWADVAAWYEAQR